MVIWSFGNNPVLIIENDQKYFKKKKKKFLAVFKTRLSEFGSA